MLGTELGNSRQGVSNGAVGWHVPMLEAELVCRIFMLKLGCQDLLNEIFVLYGVADKGVVQFVLAGRGTTAVQDSDAVL